MSLEQEYTDLHQLSPELLNAYNLIYSQHPEIIHPADLLVSPEQIEYYTQRHAEIYKESAHEVSKRQPQFTIVQSGMYGGKSTWAFYYQDMLDEKNIKTQNLIADVMGEDFVTSRSYTDGLNQRKAIRFGKLTNYFQQLNAFAQSNIDVFFLDEFSFLNLDIVLALKEMCDTTGKGLVLTGLDSTYLGNPLPAFDKSSPLMKNNHIERITCKSFVPGISDEIPLGTNTIRYANIGGNWIYDIGLLPTVVSKEHTHIVKYAPATSEQVATNVLKNSPESLEFILHPNLPEMEAREQMLKKLLASNE